MALVYFKAKFSLLMTTINGGAFTTVSGSDGRLLTVLHVEEEHLPRFVYSHLGLELRVVGQYGYSILADDMNSSFSSQLHGR